jgi:hypothetical protein
MRPFAGRVEDGHEYFSMLNGPLSNIGCKCPVCATPSTNGVDTYGLLFVLEKPMPGGPQYRRYRVLAPAAGLSVLGSWKVE